MRFRAAIALTLLAAGCDESPRVDQDKVNTQMIANVAFVQNEMGDAGATTRLQPLGAVGAMGGSDQQQCRFTQGNETLVFAVGGNALAMVAGYRRQLRAEGPIGPTGGFFRERELALSIGRVEGPSQAWRARVTNRTTNASADQEGNWQCVAVEGSPLGNLTDAPENR